MNGNSGEDEEVHRERVRIQQQIAALQEKDLELSRKFPQQQLLTPPAPPVANFWGSDKIALVSYPRSGNSFLRRIIEKLTGTITGSDGNPERTLNKQLADMGMKGEGIMDNNQVWCIKTHYPERVGRARLTCNRVILLVRNPLDCILSFFQMMVTDSHFKAISKQEFDEKYASLWVDFLNEEVSMWLQFHAHWRAIMEVDAEQCMLLRYEDLISPEKQRAEVLRLAQFMYRNLLPLEDVHDKVEALFRLPPSELGLYEPKSHTSLSRLIKSSDFYSQAQFRHVVASTRSDLVRFNYWEEVKAEWLRRTGSELDLVPYIDRNVGDCIVVKDQIFWLNSKFALRPRYPADPYGRGFDVRWEERLNAIRNKPKE